MLSMGKNPMVMQYASSLQTHRNVENQPSTQTKNVNGRLETTTHKFNFLLSSVCRARDTWPFAEFLARPVKELLLGY